MAGAYLLGARDSVALMIFWTAAWVAVYRRTRPSSGGSESRKAPLEGAPVLYRLSI